MSGRCMECDTNGTQLVSGNLCEKCDLLFKSFETQLGLGNTAADDMAFEQERQCDSYLDRLGRSRWDSMRPNAIVLLRDSYYDYVAVVTRLFDTTVVARAILCRTPGSGEWSADPLDKWMMLFFDGNNATHSGVKLLQHDWRLVADSPEYDVLIKKIESAQCWEYNYDDNDPNATIFAVHVQQGRVFEYHNGLMLRIRMHQAPCIPRMFISDPGQVLVPLRRLRVFTTESSVRRSIKEQLAEDMVFRAIFAPNDPLTIEQFEPEIRPPFNLDMQDPSDIRITVPNGFGGIEIVSHRTVSRLDNPTIGGGGAFAYDTEVMTLWCRHNAIDKTLHIVHFHIRTNADNVPFTVLDIREEPNATGVTRVLTDADIEKRAYAADVPSGGFLSVVYNTTLRAIFYRLPGTDELVHVRFVQHTLPPIGTMIKAVDGSHYLFGRITHQPNGIDPQTNELQEDQYVGESVLDLCSRTGTKSSLDLHGMLGVRWAMRRDAESGRTETMSQQSCVSACAIQVLESTDPLCATIESLFDGEILDLARREFDECLRIYDALNKKIRDPRYTPQDQDSLDLDRGFDMIRQTLETLGRMHHVDETLRTRVIELRQSLERCQRALAGISRLKRPADSDGADAKRTATQISLGTKAKRADQ